jgi:MFS transporter, FHS family, L-fucose permease
MGIRREQAAVLAAAYYGAYIPGTLMIGGPLVRKVGYRGTMIAGLFILAVGKLLMSFGAASCSLDGMVFAHFIIGLAVSTLERSANSYAVNCGPERHATLRILFAQSWAGIGTVVAPFLANTFIFDLDSSKVPPLPDPTRPGHCLMPGKASSGCDKLGTVITFYRLLGACVAGLATTIALIFFRTHWFPEIIVPLPAARIRCGWRFWTHPLASRKYSRMWWAWISNFFNLGCQVTFAQFIIEHMKVDACQSDRMAATWMSVAQSAFVIGRLVAAGLVAFPRTFRPRWVLFFFIAGAVAMTGTGTNVIGTTAITLAVMVMFFEAPSFPMIFESATAGFDEWK